MQVGQMEGYPFQITKTVFKLVKGLAHSWDMQVGCQKLLENFFCGQESTTKPYEKIKSFLHLKGKMLHVTCCLHCEDQGSIQCAFSQVEILLPFDRIMPFMFLSEPGFSGQIVWH